MGTKNLIIMIGVKKFYIVFAMTLFMFFLVEIQGRGLDRLGSCKSSNDCNRGFVNVRRYCCFSPKGIIGSDIGYCTVEVTCGGSFIDLGGGAIGHQGHFGGAVGGGNLCGPTGACGKKKRSITDETEVFQEEALEAELLE